MQDKPDHGAELRRMVETQIAVRGVRDAKVLEAMSKVPRHLFVPEGLSGAAFADEPLPIGEGQTISQPYIVAYMTEALGLRGGERVLEIGTGSGYQTAVLAEIAGRVFTVELIESLSAKAQTLLGSLGYDNISFRVGDGARGWPEEAPFEAILVTAAAAAVPPALDRQLGPAGTMVVPVGTDWQELIRFRRRDKGLARERLLSVRFVPLVTTH
ncbi:MAG: protein-L-isoaspartate(D-aspartate) O-methyltransferase [Acidobacteriota bacterium]